MDPCHLSGSHHTQLSLIGYFLCSKKYGEALQLALQDCPAMEEGEDAVVTEP